MNIFYALMMIFSVYFISCSSWDKIATGENLSLSHSHSHEFDPCSIIVNVENCPNFIDDIQNAKEALAVSCISAGFDNTTIVETDRPNCFGIITEKGYAKITIDTARKTCRVELYSEDERYNFPAFITAMLEFIGCLDIVEAEISED